GQFQDDGKDIPPVRRPQPITRGRSREASQLPQVNNGRVEWLANRPCSKHGLGVVGSDQIREKNKQFQLDWRKRPPSYSLPLIHTRLEAAPQFPNGNAKAQSGNPSLVPVKDEVELCGVALRSYINPMVLRSSRGRPVYAPGAFIHPCEP